MKSVFNSLSVRLTCAMTAILMLAGALTGVAVYRTVRESVRDEFKSRLKQRLSWLQNSIELDEDKLDFEPKLMSNAPDKFSISTSDGKVLWEQNWNDNPEMIAGFRTATWGAPNGKRIVSSNVQLKSGSPLIAPGTAPASYRIDDKDGRIDLRFGVRESNAPAEQELARIALALWTIGPLSIALLSLLLALFIRWQLSSLAEMSQAARLIGPENTAVRIGPAGSSSELASLRDSINSMVERLAAGMQRERQFASMAAHELRTPLAQLRISAEVALRKERGAEEYREALRGSLLDVERLQKLIDNLLFITRNSDGMDTSRNVALNRVLELAQRDSASKAAAAENLRDMAVCGNEELLVSAFRNVLENAARYAPGAAPEVSATIENGAVFVAISDHGPGIREGDRERIFEPLTRLDEARSITHAAGGYGLGLTVARISAQACGGNLACRARADGKPGAEFIFNLKSAI